MKFYSRNSPTSLFDLYFDLLRLSFLAFRQCDCQQSVLELRKDLVRVDVGWQCEAAQEFAIGTFDAMKVLAFYFLCKLSLASDRQHIVLDADEHVFLRQTGELGSHDDFLVGFIDVAGRRPVHKRHCLRHEWSHWKIKESIQSVLKQVEGISRHVAEALDWSHRCSLFHGYFLLAFIRTLTSRQSAHKDSRSAVRQHSHFAARLERFLRISGEIVLAAPEK